MTDPLSPIARRLLKLNAVHAYGKLVITDADAHAEALSDLSAATPENLFTHPPTSPSDARAALAALYLWHDYLRDAHELSQEIETPTGSLWHAILHRREGDFGNAKYWYARAEGHPALDAIAVAFTANLRNEPADTKLLRLTSPDTCGPALVDLAQQTHDSANRPRHALAARLQQQEWRTLFDWTVAHASR